MPTSTVPGTVLSVQAHCEIRQARKVGGWLAAAAAAALSRLCAAWSADRLPPSSPRHARARLFGALLLPRRNLKRWGGTTEESVAYSLPRASCIAGVQGVGCSKGRKQSAQIDLFRAGGCANACGRVSWPLPSLSVDWPQAAREEKAVFPMKLIRNKHVMAA